MSARPRFVNATARTSPVVKLCFPFREADVRKLPLGTEVSISGTVYTGRDRLHKYLFEDGESPVDLRDSAIFHCGPIVVRDGEGKWKVVAAGPTTSSRENPYMPEIISERGIRVILGKGGMNGETQTACRENGCIYIQVVGGAAALLAKCVKRVDGVWFLDEFGATEAMWKLEVEDLTGIVAINANGESLFSGVEQLSRRRLKALVGSPFILDVRKAGKPGTEYHQVHDGAGALPPLKVVFMGSADVSCAVLKQLVETPGYDVQCVITRPDKPSGRDRRAPTPCPAKAYAEKLGLKVIAPETLRESADKLETVRQIREMNPDVIVVAAYGLILGYNVLSLPRLGCVNVHLSLLPKYRGASPVHRCIENGDTVSGVTIMKMDSGLDSGDILMQAEEQIRPDDTAGTLHDRLSQLGAALLMKCLPKLQSGLITPRKQNARDVTFANKLGKGDGLIDWTMPADAIALRVRAFNPWPSCWTYFLPKGGGPERERLKVLFARAEPMPADCAAEPGTIADISRDGIAVAAGAGTMLRLTEVRREGGKSLSGAQFAQGIRAVAGQRFAAPPEP